MSTLDEKLRDVLLSRTLGMYASNGDGELVPVNWHESPVIDQYVEEIKQAFKDADYMSSQEWYDRFERELKGWIDGAYSGDTDSVLDAAKRAGGLS